MEALVLDMTNGSCLGGPVSVRTACMVDLIFFLVLANGGEGLSSTMICPNGALHFLLLDLKVCYDSM